MAEGATVIGRVAVKVIPDTDGFRDEVLAFLRSEESTLPSLTIELHADVAQAVADVEAAVEAAEQATKDSLKLKLNLDDQGELRRGIARVEAELNKIRATEIEVELDEDSLEELKSNFEDSLKELQTIARDAEIQLDNKVFTGIREKVDKALSKITLDVDVDPLAEHKLKQELDGMYERIEDLKLQIAPEIQISDREKRKVEREIEDIEAKIDIKISETSQRFAQARLALLARSRFADIVPKINEAAYAKTMGALAALSGARAFKQLTTDFVDWVSNLDKALPKMAAMSLAVTNLGGSLLAGTSNVLSFGSSLASVAGAGLALPGILGGIATGTGAMIAVLKDFNDRIPEMADKLHALQDQMSDKFWARAETPIRRLIDSLFPQFSAAIQRTSADLGTFFARLSNSARNVFDGELDQMFNDLNESIRIASRYTDNFVGIIEKLGSVGAGNLPRLATWFGDISKKFDGWLDKKGTSGLQEYVDTGVEGLKDLGGIAANTGSLLAGLAKAAETGGGGTLQALRDVTEGAARIVNGARFQGALSNMFAGAHEGMDELTKRSGPAFESFMLRLAHTLSRVLPLAGQAAGDALSGIFSALDQSSVENSLVGIFRKLGTAVDNITPSLDDVADGLAGIIDIAGDVGVQLSRALGPALENLGSNADKLSKDLEPLVEQLGDLLVNAVEIAGPVVSDLATAIGLLARGIAAALKPVNVFIDVMQKLPDPIKSVLGMLTALGVVVGAGAWFGNAVRAKVALMGKTLLAAGEQATFASGALTRAGTAAQTMSKKITPGRVALLGLGVAALGVADKVGLTNAATFGLMGSMLGPLGGAAGAAVGAFLDIKGASDKARASIDDFRDSLKSNDINQFAAQFEALYTGTEKLTDDLNDLSGVGDFISDSMSGWQDALGTGLSDLQGESKEAVAQLTNLTGVLSGVAQANGDFIRSYSNGVQNFGFGNLEDITRVATEAKPALDNLGLSIQALASMDAGQQDEAIAAINAELQRLQGKPAQVDAVAAAVKGLGSDLGTTASRADSLSASLEKLLSPALNAEEATDQWHQTLLGLQTEMNKVGGFKGFTKAALENKAASRQYVTDTIAMLSARAKAGASEQTIARLMRQSRAAFIEQGTAITGNAKQIRERARVLGLTPKMVRTVFQAIGLDKTRNDVKGLGKDIEKTGKAKPGTAAWLSSLTSDVNKGKSHADKGTAEINRILAGNSRKWKADLGPFIHDIDKGLTTAKSTATSGGNAVGNNLQAGVLAGFAGTAAALAAQAAAAVRGAVKAAKHAGVIKSPSRKMMEVGRYLAKGMVVGWQQVSPQTLNAVEKTVKDALDRATRLATKYHKHVSGELTQLKNKYEQVFKKAGAAHKKQLKAQLDGVLSVNKHYEKQFKLLEKTAARLKSLTQQAAAYKQQVIDQIVATGDPTRDGANSFGAIIDMLTIARDEAVKFAAVIADLKNKKLNKDTIAQLVAAGPEAALASAQAILESGKAGIKQVNGLMDDIRDAGKDLGTTASQSMFGPQIAATKADLKGLLKAIKPLQDKLAKAVEKLMNQLAAEIRKGNKKIEHEVGQTGKGSGSGKGDDKSPAKKTGTDYLNRSAAATAGSTNVLNYYAAPGPQVSSEESLFAAGKRGRMVFA